MMSLYNPTNFENMTLHVGLRFCLTSCFASVFTSHSVSNSIVSKVSKIVLEVNLHDAICSNNLQHTNDIASCERKYRTSLSQGSLMPTGDLVTTDFLTAPCIGVNPTCLRYCSLVPHCAVCLLTVLM